MDLPDKTAIVASTEGAIHISRIVCKNAGHALSNESAATTLSRHHSYSRRVRDCGAARIYITGETTGIVITGYITIHETVVNTAQSGRIVFDYVACEATDMLSFQICHIHNSIAILDVPSMVSDKAAEFQRSSLLIG